MENNEEQNEENSVDPNDEIDRIAGITKGKTETEEITAKSKLRKKRIMIVAAIIILIIAGAGAFFTMQKEPKEETSNKETHTNNKTNGVSMYLTIDDFIVNLNSSSNQPRFLKLSVALELSSEKDKNHAIANMPKIRDSFHIYLRELRSEDLKGSQALFRLREELLLRVNKLLYPTSIKDIFFNEIIVQ